MSESPHQHTCPVDDHVLQVAPCCRASFITYGGINVLLDSLTAASVSTGSTTWLATSPVGPRSPGKAGSSSPAGRSCQPAVDCSSCSSGEPALRLLRQLVRADAAMAAAVASEGCVLVLLQLLEAPAAATLTPIRQGVLLCLSELCSAEGHGCMTAVWDADGVGLLLKQCQRCVATKQLSLHCMQLLWFNVYDVNMSPRYPSVMHWGRRGTYASSRQRGD